MAWNPDLTSADDRAFWIGRIEERFGCGSEAAAEILDAYNAAGEVAPMLIRRLGITEGNRQTLSLGMTLDQLVNPKRYNAITELWESQAPPGERLDEYVRKEWNKEPHAGETPESVSKAALDFALAAESHLHVASGFEIRNREEFRRLQQDASHIVWMAIFYRTKTLAAQSVLKYGYSRDLKDMEEAGRHMSTSVDAFRALAKNTVDAYQFANSMQTGHRKIPFGGAANGVGTNYHWSHVLPLYEKELADFEASLAELKNPSAGSREQISAWPRARFSLISTNAETYEVNLGARPFADRKYTLTELAPELNGLIGIRFSHEAAKNGRYVPIEFEAAEPVRVLIGYFQNERDIWLQVPNLDFASHADERGGVDTVLRNAAAIEECPNVNVHAFRYEPGRHKLELIGKGSFVVLGVVPQSVTLQKRDAKLGMK